MAPRICQRALVSPSPATSRSPAVRIRLLSLENVEDEVGQYHQDGRRSSNACSFVAISRVLTSSCQSNMSLSYRIDIMQANVRSSSCPICNPWIPPSRSNVSSRSMRPPVVLVNVFTLDKADEQAFLEAWQVDAASWHEAAAGVHLDPTSPRDRRRP